MCLPAVALAAIATGLGGALQYAGQQKADHALTRTFNRERDRQHAFEQDQIGKFQDSLNSVGNLADPNAQAAAAATRDAVLEAATKNADPVVSGYLPSSASAPQIVATAGAKAGAKANAATSSLAKAIASMGGWSDLSQQNDINIGRNSQAISQIGGFARGSMDALQPEMDAAKRKGGNLRMLGGLAQSIGTAMLTAGAGGGGGFSPMAVDSVAPLSSMKLSGAFASLPGFS